MIRRLQDDEAAVPERSTSLQPTYEDTVVIDPEEDWDDADG